MKAMILLDSLDFWVQLTRHLVHPSELTFKEWVFLACLAFPFALLAYALNRYFNAALKAGPPKGNFWW